MFNSVQRTTPAPAAPGEVRQASQAAPSAPARGQEPGVKVSRSNEEGWLESRLLEYQPPKYKSLEDIARAIESGNYQIDTRALAEHVAHDVAQGSASK
ncbi:hypothetical protein SAMN02745129_2068 [Ferrimonas marina]|uniref:Negative regulator of flagellin synthesis n=2 Tax=Ferrimonas marina TaxID=299255 RepID=A0A1M5TB57_9GAMM|nr:hypothetical protein SAMN02745129_2068 [Ferrimonas marina]